MAKVLTQAEAKSMGLPGRKSLEIVSGEKGSQAVTLRLVEIPPVKPGESPRGRHFHQGCLLYTSPSPRDGLLSRMPSSA